MRNVLIDSDILMDFLLQREPFFMDAVLILDFCERKNITGFITPVILSNVYYLLRRVENHKTIIDKLRKLMRFLEVLIINKQDVVNAIESDFSDFEDALQNYAAEQSNDITIIITRNVKDYKNSQLTVLTPTEFLKMS